MSVMLYIHTAEPLKMLLMERKNESDSEGQVHFVNKGHTTRGYDLKYFNITATVPGGSKYSIDDRALRILCAHEKNIL